MGAFVTEINALEGQLLNAKTEQPSVGGATSVEEVPQTKFSEQTDDGAIAVAEESEFRASGSANQLASGDASAVSEVANEGIGEALPEIAHLEEAARQQGVARQE